MFVAARFLPRLALPLLGLAVAAFTALMATKVWPYLGLEKGILFLTTKSEATNDNPLFRIGFYVHITSSLWVLAAGLAQFFPQWLGRRAPAWHRTLGKVYVASILGLAAPSGLILAAFANGGLAAKVGFAMQCAVWGLVTWQAYRTARQRQWGPHAEWTLRSYAVTLAALSLRLEGYGMHHLLGTKPIETYLTVTWLSWTGNLLLAEIAIQAGLARHFLRQIRRSPFLQTFMKKYLTLVVGLGALAACQHQAPTAQTAVPAGAPAAAAALTASARTAVRNAAPKPLSAEVLNLLRHYNLAPLLQTVQSAKDGRAINGFYGPERRRIELALTEVRQDPQNPGMYHLRGKDRYKGVVTPVEGVLTITKIVEQPKMTAAYIRQQKQEAVGTGNYPKIENVPYMYTAFGDFELRETPERPYAGVFAGELALDWRASTSSNDAIAESRSNFTATEGGGCKWEGTWTANNRSLTRHVVWVDDIYTYAGGQDLLADFILGDRNEEVNPKYAKLGWTSYWENDEWWADAPTAQL